MAALQPVERVTGFDTDAVVVDLLSELCWHSMSWRKTYLHNKSQIKLQFTTMTYSIVSIIIITYKNPFKYLSCQKAYPILMKTFIVEI